MAKKIVAAIVLLLGAGLIFLAVKFHQFYQHIYAPGTAVTNKNVPKTTYNILLLGYGGGQHEGTYLTDSMMIVQLDTVAKKVRMISVPRDIWVKVPTQSGADFHAKINAVYQIGLFPGNYPDLRQSYRGDGKLIKYVLSQITGLEVDHYVAMDFAGFVRVIDILGGVDINVKSAFEDKEYPIAGKERDLCGQDELFKKIEPILNKTVDEAGKTGILDSDHQLKEFYDNVMDKPYLAFPCRYEDLKFNAGMQHMDGETALKFVRSRHGIGDGSDFGRSARQQLFIQAVKDKVLSANLITKIVPVVDELKNNLKTDLDPTAIKKFIGEFGALKQYRFSSLVLSDSNFLVADNSPDGQYILTAKEGIDHWTGLLTGIRDFVLEITPAPTASPSATMRPTTR